MDAFKHAGLPLLADARAGLEALHDALDGWSAPRDHVDRARRLAREWDATVERAYTRRHRPLPAQSEVIGAVNRVSGPRDVVVCAAGSMPGDHHKLWRTRDPKGYHVEYGYSCMEYEIAGGLGVKLAAPDREVYVMVGDGSYLMMAQELVTAVQEHVKLAVILVQNHGFASIGELSERLGSQRFGTRDRYRNPATGALTASCCPSTWEPTPRASAPSSCAPRRSRSSTARWPPGASMRSPRQRRRPFVKTIHSARTP